MADELFQTIAHQLHQYAVRDVLLSALEQVWQYGNLDKRATLDNVALDGTVIKYDDRLTETVRKAIDFARKNPRQHEQDEKNVDDRVG